MLDDKKGLGLNSRNKAGKNFAKIEFEISGERGTIYAMSGQKSPQGTVSIPGNRRFVTVDVRGRTRAFDSEVKMFEYLADNYDVGSHGKITLKSELIVCPSCKGVTSQFDEMFKGLIEIEVRSGPYKQKNHMFKKQ